MNRIIHSLRLVAAFGVAASLAFTPAAVFANAGAGKEGAETAKDGKPAKPPKAPKKKPPPAAAKDEKVGYSDTLIQLKGMMVPYRTSGGSSYEVVSIRLQVAPGLNERAACFMAPIVHEKLLMYMHGAKLEAADFSGERRDVLMKNLLDVAIKTTDRSFYTAVQIINPADAAPLDPKSQTLSSQCS